MNMLRLKIKEGISKNCIKKALNKGLLDSDMASKVRNYLKTGKQPIITIKKI